MKGIMERELKDKMIAKARENGNKYGKSAELDFGAGAEWMYEQLINKPPHGANRRVKMKRKVVQIFKIDKGVLVRCDDDSLWGLRVNCNGDFSWKEIPDIPEKKIK